MGKPKSSSDSILIVGAGVFGLSIALALHERGYSDITILDRYPPPVPDGSSNDISRVIRSDYSDPFYSRLATEAIEAWKTSPLFGPSYYGVGFLTTTEATPDPYMEKNKKILASQSQIYREFDSTEKLRSLVPDIQPPLTGYINVNAGWANAAGAIKALAAHLSQRGVSFITGPRGTLRSLIVEDSRIKGVNVLSGPPHHASTVILATGAWTNRYLDLDHALLGSAQALGFIQLTADEARALARIPVTINNTSGVFIFPPPPGGENVLKVAYHGHGFEVAVPSSDDGTEHGRRRTISAPQRDQNNAAAATTLPQDAAAYLRKGLRQLVPSVAEKPWMKGRLCWYTETPRGDFVADYHYDVQGLFIATGGSGHAFKFLPVLGKYLADCFEGKATEEMRQRWKLPKAATKTRITANDGSRRGPPRRMLPREELAKL